MPRRPTPLTVAAVLFIIFGAMGIFSAIYTFSMNALGDRMPGAATNPVLQAMKADATYALFMNVTTILSAVFSVAGIIAGIFILKGSNAARKAGVGLSIWHILSTLMGVGMTVMLMPKIMEGLARLPGMNEKALTIVKAAMWVGLGFGVLTGLAVGISILVMLTRPVSVAFCRTAQSNPPPLG